MAQHQYHCLLILLSSACLLNQILAQSGSISFTDPFNSTYTTSNPYKPDIYFDFTTKHAVLYQIIYNTTDASFVDLSNMAVTYTNIPVPTIVIPEGSVNTTYNANGNNVAVFGQVIDPCVFAAPGGRATLTFNASTDAVSGEITSVIGAIEIATIQNATAFEYSSPAPLQMTGDVNNNFQASRYYFLDLNANGSENFGLEATSSEDIFLSIAGLGNCPTFQFTDKSPYWSGSVAANQSVTTSVVASNETSFVWVLVTSNKPATVTLTWTYLGSTPVSDPTPASEPTSASEPTAQTPNQKTDELPTWATAVLVVFGIVIAILLIVVIVMCVKNRRRSTYQGV